MTPSLESVVQQIEQALKTAPTGGFYVDLRLASACNPQSIRVLLDALDEAQRDAKRYRAIRSSKRYRQGTELLGGRLEIERDEKSMLASFAFWCTPEQLDAAIDKAMEQPK